MMNIRQIKFVIRRPIDRMVNFVREVRIKVDFPQYEKQCCLEHEHCAERMHSTQQLEIESRTLMSKIQNQADIFFKKDIDELLAGITKIKTAISEKEEILDIFTKHYNQELDRLYEEKNAFSAEKEDVYNSKNELSSEISDAVERKKTAYEELNYYKDCVDSWYAKSDRTPWLFGNSGKKLPKHSLFGQSFGDLDSYKYRRDSAYQDVQNCNEEIGELKRKQHHLNQRINEIKQAIGVLVHDIKGTKGDRNRMYQLKKEGCNEGQLRNILRDLYHTLKKEQLKLNDLESERKEFVTAEKYRNGVIERENKIKDIKEKKIKYMKEFDLEDNHKLRVKEHRLIWLKKRKLGP